MPCELKGFRGLGISKGVVLVLEKAFLGVLWTFTTQTTFFCACPDLLEKQQSRTGQVTTIALNTVHAHCMLVIACRL